MEWKEIELDQFIVFNPKVDLKVGDKAKKIAMTDLIEFNKKINSYVYSVFAGGAKFQNNDILLARITPCLENGKTAYVDILKDDESAFGSTEFIVLRGKQNTSNSQFIYYLSISPDFRNIAIQAMTGSSGRQRVQLDLLQKTIMLLPPLPEQRAIAEILSSIDDKIELNNQMNRTLEAMAQAIFNQWFVDFEFLQNPLRPGEGGPPAVGEVGYKSSGGKMIDSELGPIPEGWECVYYTDIINVLGGGTPSKNNDAYWNGHIPFFTPKDIGNSSYIFRTEDYINEEGLKNCNSKLYPRNTVFITARGTVGKICLAGIDMAMNQSCYALSGIKDIGQFFVYMQTLDLISRLKQNSHGSVFSTITTDTFRKIKIIKPDVKIISIFENSVSPIFDMIHNNTIESQTLSALRDSLLPKLMSGELRVPEEIVKRYEEMVSEA